MLLNTRKMTFHFTDDTEKVIKLLSESGKPEYSVEITQDITLQDPPSYEELFKIMELYKSKLIAIRNYEANSLNNYREFIKSRTRDIE